MATLGSIAFALGLLAIGCGALIAPGASRAMYGIAAAQSADVAFVRASGARDIILGALIAAFLMNGDGAALAWSIAAAGALSAADAAIVSFSRRRIDRYVVPHAIGMLAALVVWILLRAGR